jgi:MFS family permease
VLLTGKVLSSLAFFSTAPYLTLYLTTVHGLSAAAAGAVVGSVALIGSVGGVAGGMLIDRFGAVALMRLALIVYAGLYLAMAALPTVTVTCLATALIGTVRMVLEPSVKRLMSAAAGSNGAVFRRRYVAISAGAIIGPPIGAFLYHVGPSTFFLVPGLVLLVYVILVSVSVTELAAFDVRAQCDPMSWRRGLTDPVLLRIVAIGVLTFVVFAQFDSTFPLVLNEMFAGSAAATYSALLVADAVLGIAFQPPVIWLSARCSRRAVVATGCVGFCGFFLLLVLVTQHPVVLVPGVVLFAWGEAVLVPLPDIMLHEAAPADRKATWFGVGELRYVGFFLGPVVGGFLLSWGHAALGLAGAALSAVVVVAMWRARAPEVRP